MAQVFANAPGVPEGLRRGLRAVRAYAAGVSVAQEHAVFTGDSNWALAFQWLTRSVPALDSALTWPSANGAGLRQWDENDEKVCTAIMTAIKGRKGAAASEPTRETIRHVYDIMCTNSLCINPGIYVAETKEELPTRKLGYYPIFSMLNHACTPNCKLETLPGRGGKNGSKKVLITLRPVAKDEELTIEYVSDTFNTLPVEVRRAYLVTEFGFVCQCAQCLRQSAEDAPVAK